MAAVAGGPTTTAITACVCWLRTPCGNSIALVPPCWLASPWHWACIAAAPSSKLAPGSSACNFGQSKPAANRGIFNGHEKPGGSPPPLSLSLTRSITMHTITNDGTRLFLSRLGDRGSPPLILAHGTFTNQRSCAPLASHLAARGWQCWLFDWRGHGHSDQPPAAFNFETLASQDVPAVLRVVEENCGPLRPFGLGHSAGAVIASMWLARQPAGCGWTDRAAAPPRVAATRRRTRWRRGPGRACGPRCDRRSAGHGHFVP